MPAFHVWIELSGRRMKEVFFAWMARCDCGFDRSHMTLPLTLSACLVTINLLIGCAVYEMMLLVLGCSSDLHADEMVQHSFSLNDLSGRLAAHCLAKVELLFPLKVLLFYLRVCLRTWLLCCLSKAVE